MANAPDPLPEDKQTVSIQSRPERPDPNDIEAVMRHELAQVAKLDPSMTPARINEIVRKRMAELNDKPD